jgi:hypothetical protein
MEINYPADLFPPVWTQFKELFVSGRGYILDSVSDELSEKDDAVFQWIDQLGPSIISKLTTEDLEKALEVIARFPGFVDINATKTSADPFVVAEAIRTGAVVVTHETAINSQPNSKKAKIPNACAEYGVRSVHTKTGSTVFTDFFREQGWQF